MRQQLKGQIVRFGVVGVTATVIHYGIYYVLLPHIDRNIAYTVGYLISFLCNFLLSSWFTFRVQPSWARFMKFGGSHGVNYFVSTALYNLFYWIGFSAELAPLPVYLISVPLNFLLVRLALTRKAKKKNHAIQDCNQRH